MRCRGFPIALVFLFLGGCADNDPPAPLGPEVGAVSMAKGKGKGGKPSPPADPEIVYLDYVRGKKGGGDRDRLVVMNKDGSNQTEIYSAPHLLRPSWSPSAESIVFRRDSDSQAELWIVDVVIRDGEPQGSNPRRLIDQCGASFNTPFIGCEPAWSPQGSTIAFTDEGDHLWVIAADGSQGASKLYSGHWLAAPAWSPDGGRIAVVEESTLIRVLTSAGAVKRTLDFTADFHVIGDLDWARTNDVLAFSGVAKSGGEAVYTVDLSQVTPTPIEVAEGESPTWSPDDGHLALIQRGQKLVSLDLSTGTATRLAADALDPDWAR